MTLAACSRPFISWRGRARGFSGTDSAVETSSERMVMDPLLRIVPRSVMVCVLITDGDGGGGCRPNLLENLLRRDRKGPSLRELFLVVAPSERT